MTLAGRQILIAAGHPWEDIDGIRRYANHARPADHGRKIAAWYEQHGAHVTVVEATGSALQLEQQVRQQWQKTSFDMLLQMACWSSVRAAQIAPSKIKAKQDAHSTVRFDVVGNSDLAASLQQIAAAHTVAGFAHDGQLFARGDDVLIASFHRALREIDAPAAAQARLPAGGMHVLMTSGPTAEPINVAGDVLTNFSSGRQGAEIADALARAGVQVTFVTGPAIQPSEKNVRIVEVQTAEEMLAACLSSLPADVFIGVAAVADFRPTQALSPLATGATATMELVQNPDVLSIIGHHVRRPRLVVGFAAENDEAQLEAYAAGKLQRKNIDMILANPITPAVLGGGNHNEVTLLLRQAEKVSVEPWGKCSKREIAQRLAGYISNIS